MRAREFITESGLTRSILSDVQKTLPSSYVIPELQNNDFYKQYRFGVALAGAKGAEQRKQDKIPEYSTETPWGENEVVIAYAGDEMEEKFINDALKEVGLGAKSAKRISTPKSQEPGYVTKDSILKPFKGFSK